MQVVSSTTEFQEMIDGTFDHAVSLVMPTIETSREVEQNRIRFKNLMKLAVQQLVEGGMGEQAAEQYLKPFMERYHDGQFWQHQTQGLAAYLLDGEATYHHLLHSPDELVTVGEHCYLTPLAVDVSLHQRVLLLSLTWDEARLFDVTLKSWEELENDQFPVALRDLLLPPDTEEQLQFRTQQVAIGPDVHFHGQGEGEDIIESDRRLYLGEVGKRLNKVLETNTRRLFLAATEEVAGHFFAGTDFTARDESQPSHDKYQVVELRLSPAGLNEEQLKQRVRKELTEPEDSARLGERLGTALSQGLATRDVTEALHAAATARVEELIFDPSQRAWGTWDADHLQAEVLGSRNCPDQKCMELVNLAILKTWQTGGKVQAVSDLSVGLSPLAAFFRYR
jgi:hypothetical protein